MDNLLAPILRYLSNDAKFDIVQMVFIGVILWFFLRSKAVKALRDTVGEQSRRMVRLEMRISRLENVIIEMGCVKSPFCEARVPFLMDQMRTRLDDVEEDTHG